MMSVVTLFGPSLNVEMALVPVVPVTPICTRLFALIQPES